MARNITRDQIADFIFNSGLYFVLSLSFFYKFRVFDIQESQLLWPVFWVRQSNVEFVVLGSQITLALAPFLTLIKKSRFIGQTLTFLAALILISICYSNGKSYHSGLSWIIFMFALFGVRRFAKSHHATHFAFFCFSTAYISSGLWKFRSLTSHIWNTGDFSVILYTLQEHISSSAVERVQSPTFFGSLVLEHLWMSGLLWIIAISVELSALLIPFFRRQAWLFALALTGFHIGVLLTMRINFIPSIALLLTLALYFFLKKEDLSKI